MNDGEELISKDALADAAESRRESVERTLDNLIAVVSTNIFALNQEMKANNVPRNQRRQIIRELVKAAK